MDEQEANDQVSEFERQQYLLELIHIRNQAQRQILYGIAWWLGSSIAMYFALTSTGSSIYWYGGAIGALFHWYRAFKIISITSEAGLKKLMRNEALVMGLAAIVVAGSTLTIVPEFFRIETPTVGTCWAKVEADGKYAPVACWSGSAVQKTIGYASSPEGCPSLSSGYFEPSYEESRVTCLSSDI